VHDLLMDTGLGAKAYAIIEQGKIGMILSSRPTDRRQLIEEAAGITKYKSAPPRRGAEARSGAAEPHARRRHRLRGREAARHAEAPGGEGAPLQAAARRAAALGEGAVRAALPQLGEAIERRAARLADARERERRPRRASPKSKRRSSGCASS
jgi:DNA repair exonuclease SbcCD ATPase subunit